MAAVPRFYEDLAMMPPQPSLPGGESVLQAQEQAWNTIEEIRGLHQEEDVVVVSQNFTILGLV